MFQFQSECVLCQKISTSKKNHSEFSFQCSPHLSVWKSPFENLWPGAVMILFEEHNEEMSEVYPRQLDECHHVLLSLEKAVKLSTKCKRINFVKFGNVSSHLHWHIIPRYQEEQFSEKSPWELMHKSHSELYEQYLNLKNADLRIEIKKNFTHFFHHRENIFFGCALIFRNIHKEIQNKLSDKKKEDVIQQIRQDPSSWETLLMKQNYRHRLWDNIGGNNNANEFPTDTMIREVQEETGWKLAWSQEVTRQWRYGQTEGYIFVALPSDNHYSKNDPPRVLCHEIEKIEYFSLKTVLNSEQFSQNVQGRLKAFLEGRVDFSL